MPLFISFLLLFLLLQTPPAPPVFGTLALWPGLSGHQTGPVVSTVPLPAGVLTAQDDLPPALHVLPHN